MVYTLSFRQSEMRLTILWIFKYH